MRTSEIQFELMIAYMEQHGDLSKCTEPWGRVKSIRHWEKLTSMLNRDGSGDKKSTEKWRKVWSDLKNNTKKKAARIKAAGHEPTVEYNLRDVEQRILNLIKKEAGTGLAVDEDVHIEPSAVSVNAKSSSPFAIVNLEQSTVPSNESGTSSQPNEVPVMTSHPTSPLNIPVDDEIIDDKEELNDPLVLETQSHAESVSEVQSICSGQTTPRHNRRSTKTRASLRRLVSSSRTEDAALQFLRSNTEWRKFKKQQHRDYMDLRREQNRIREMEVLAQREWQTIGLRALDLLDKLVTKYCKN